MKRAKSSGLIVVSGELLQPPHWKASRYFMTEDATVSIRDPENPDNILSTIQLGDQVECRITSEGRSRSIVGTNQFTSGLEIVSEGKESMLFRFPDKLHCVRFLSGIARVCGVHNVMELVLKLKAQNDFFRFMHSAAESNPDGVVGGISKSKELSKSRLRERKASITENNFIATKPGPAPAALPSDDKAPSAAERVGSGSLRSIFPSFQSVGSEGVVSIDSIAPPASVPRTAYKPFETYICGFYGDGWRHRVMIVNEIDRQLEAKMRKGASTSLVLATTWPIHTVFCRVLSEVALAAVAPITLSSELSLIEPDSVALELLMTVPSPPEPEDSSTAGGKQAKTSHRMIVLFANKDEASRFLRQIENTAVTHNVASLLLDEEVDDGSNIPFAAGPDASLSPIGRDPRTSSIVSRRKSSLQQRLIEMEEKKEEEEEEIKNHDSDDSSAGEEDVGRRRSTRTRSARVASTCSVNYGQSPLKRFPGSRNASVQDHSELPSASLDSPKLPTFDADGRRRTSSVLVTGHRYRRQSDAQRLRSITRGSVVEGEECRLACDPSRRRRNSRLGSISVNEIAAGRASVTGAAAIETRFFGSALVNEAISSLARDDDESHVVTDEDRVSLSSIDVMQTAEAVAVDKNGLLSYQNMNTITFDQLDDIIDRLTNNNEKIRELSFASCDLMDDCVADVVESVFTNQSILVLNLENNCCGLEASLSLANLFLFNSTITELNLSGNDISDDGALALSDVLAFNGALRKLNLCDNDIRSVGAASLAAVLLENTSLEELDMSENGIGVYGARDFADALLNSATLRYLDVSHQRPRKLGSEGAMHFARALRGNTSLRTLKLASNRILFEGCRYLCGALLVNSTLTALDIGGKNVLTVEGGMQLAQALSYNNSLEFLSIGNYTLPVKTLKGVDASPSENDDEELADAEEKMKLRLDIQQLRNSSAREAVGLIDMQSLDDLATVAGMLLQNNIVMQEVRVVKAFVPVHVLNGSDPTASSVDVANLGLTSADAVMVGHLISENRRLKVLALHGNNFANSEGENSIVNALAKNSGLKVDPVWTPDNMFADGYKALASHQGLSTAGVLVEPMLMDGYLNKACLIGACFMFYISWISDWATLYIFRSNPDVYSFDWALLIFIFINLPAALISYTNLRGMAKSPNTRWSYVITRLIKIWFHLDFFIETYKSFIAEIEMVTLLETKFMHAIYRSIPNCLLQLFIVFMVAEATGTFSYVVVLSTGLGLVSMSALFYILYDRAEIRLISFAPTQSNPQIASFITGLIFKDSIKELSNYNAIFIVHFCISVVYHSLELLSRGTCVTWLLSHTPRHLVWLVIVILFSSRMVLLYALDRKVYQLPLVQNMLTALTLCVSDSAWRKDFESPWYSHRMSFIVIGWTMLENIGCLIVGVLSPDKVSLISRRSAELIATSITLVIAARFVLLRFWALPLHYAELYLVRPNGLIPVPKTTSGLQMENAKRRRKGPRAYQSIESAFAAQSKAVDFTSVQFSMDEANLDEEDNVSRDYGIDPPKMKFEMKNEFGSPQGSDPARARAMTTPLSLFTLSNLHPSEHSQVSSRTSKYCWIGWMEKGGGHTAMLGNFSWVLVTIIKSAVNYWRPPSEMLASLKDEERKARLFPMEAANRGLDDSGLEFRGFEKKGRFEIDEILSVRPEMRVSCSVCYHLLEIDVGFRVFHFRSKNAYDRNQFQYLLNQRLNSWMSTSSTSAEA